MGAKAGVPVRFTNEDVEMLRNVAPLIRHIARTSDKQATVQNGLKDFELAVNGIDPSALAIWNLQMDEGRFLNEEDNISHGRYAVIGSEARDKLFLGQFRRLDDTIRINGVSFQVIGVAAPRMQEGDSDINRQIYIPTTLWTLCRTFITWGNLARLRRHGP